MMISGIPILVGILNILIILVPIGFIMRIISKNSPSISMNTKKIFAMIYIIVLCVALLIFYLIPNKNFIPSDYSQEKSDYNNVENGVDGFKQLVIDGKLSFSKEFIKQGSNNFQIKGQFLRIQGGTDVNEKIWVERKKEDDGKIQVTNYAVKSIFHGIDITNKFLPLISHFKDDTLTIDKVVDKEINISAFDYDFTVNQFIKDKNNQSSFVVPYHYTRIILIKIPKNAQIDLNKSNVQMIN